MWWPLRRCVDCRRYGIAEENTEYSSAEIASPRGVLQEDKDSSLKTTLIKLQQHDDVPRGVHKEDHQENSTLEMAFRQLLLEGL